MLGADDTAMFPYVLSAAIGVGIAWYAVETGTYANRSARKWVALATAPLRHMTGSPSARRTDPVELHGVETSHSGDSSSDTYVRSKALFPSRRRPFARLTLLRFLVVLTGALLILSRTMWPCAPPTDSWYMDQAYQNLYQISDFLNRHGIQYFLVESALLFAVRDGGFGMWDYNDVDLGLKLGESEKLWALREEFDSAGFYLKRHRTNGFSVTPWKFKFRLYYPSLSAFFYEYVVFLGRKVAVP